MVLKGHRHFESYMHDFFQREETVLRNSLNWIEWSLHGWVTVKMKKGYF